MLQEAMLALRVTDMEYAPEICQYLKAAELDLRMAGILPGGECDFVITVTTDQEIQVTDNSTITNEAIQMAMLTYVRMHFGSPADYDRLAASYDTQKGQLMNATGYTTWGDEPEPEPEPEPDPDDGGEGGDGE